MVKGILFGLLLLSAAVWDMRNQEIPNLIPILLSLCGLIGFRPAAPTAGLLLVGGPLLLAVVLTKRDGFAIGGGDMKLMGAYGLIPGVWPGLVQAVLSPSLAVLAGTMEYCVQKRPLSAARLPLAPFSCFGSVTAYWLTAFAFQIQTSGGIKLNKNILRNRTVIGVVCILLAVPVCFGVTPLFNEGLKAQMEAVWVKAEVIPRGIYITADMVEVYIRGTSGIEDGIATSPDEVVGGYTYVELRKNTDVNTTWLSLEPLTQYEYLTQLNGSKAVISVTIPTFAKGGSGKVETGDTIMLFAVDKDTGETAQPPELKYVGVLAATQSSGADKEYWAPVENEEEEDPEETLLAIIILPVNSEQAQFLAHLEEFNSLHLVFVYRGTRANAEKLPATQDAFFAEPEAEADGENSQPGAPVDGADGGQPVEGAEEQEVETTDGE